MRITKMTFSATIPTGQYANIQPSIEIELDSPGDKARIAEAEGMAFIKELYARFSTGGELKEKKPLSDSEIIRNMV